MYVVLKYFPLQVEESLYVIATFTVFEVPVAIPVKSQATFPQACRLAILVPDLLK